MLEESPSPALSNLGPKVVSKLPISALRQEFARGLLSPGIVLGPARLGMFGALVGAVNAIFFGLKRAHQSTLRVTRRVLAACGLTAARFDLLYVLLESPQLPMPQRELRQTLGVTGPTVSRMLASLEKLGLVHRIRGFRDRRQRLVGLTIRGMRRIRRARAVFIRSGWAQLVVDTALGGERWWDLGHCFLRMDALEGMLRAVRYAYRDTGWVIYRWHPEG